MRWLRTIPRLVRVLVALFVVTQFAGVVSSPLASVRNTLSTVASHVHSHHIDEHRGGAMFHSNGDRNGNHLDPCCALHAFFTGVLPVVIAVEAVDTAGQQFAVDLADVIFGIDPSRLDRPPRPFALI